MDNKEKQFEQMVQLHKQVMYTACYMFSHDENEVADLLQETLINLWKGICRGNASMLTAPHDEQKAWAYRVALNTCISWNRKKKKHPTVPLTMDVSPFADTDMRSRQAEMLHRRIGALQPFDRAIILLWLEDLTYEEIGDIMGLTAKNVSVRLVRIREQLKNTNH